MIEGQRLVLRPWHEFDVEGRMGVSCLMKMIFKKNQCKAVARDKRRLSSIFMPAVS